MSETVLSVCVCTHTQGCMCFSSNPPLLKYPPIPKLNMTVLPTTVKLQFSLHLSCHPYSMHRLTHLSPSLASSLPHELPLPSLHPSLTSHMPPTPPPCQLTPEHGHIVLPFDPLPACRSTPDPRPTASVLVCHRVLSRRSVIDGSR